MVKIIETNISMNYSNEIIDHQSRIIEVSSWNEYIEEIKTRKTISRKSFLGNLIGVTIPKMAIVENLVYDDFHLSCDVINYKGIRDKKLCYLIK